MGLSVFINFALAVTFTYISKRDFDDLYIQGSPFVVLLINFVSAALSTIVVILFVLATIGSYIANNISVIQQFLDNHTAVLEKPLQTLGAMAVFIFTVLFWSWFGIHWLYTAAL